MRSGRPSEGTALRSGASRTDPLLPLRCGPRRPALAGLCTAVASGLCFGLFRPQALSAGPGEVGRLNPRTLLTPMPAPPLHPAPLNSSLRDRLHAVSFEASAREQRPQSQSPVLSRERRGSALSHPPDPHHRPARQVSGCGPGPLWSRASPETHALRGWASFSRRNKHRLTEVKDVPQVTAGVQICRCPCHPATQEMETQDPCAWLPT